MMVRSALLLLAAIGVTATGRAMNAGAMPGVANPARAQQNWILQCQGCHRADASGTPATTPAMANIIGRFLTVPGGREYLAQVPGVATAALPDQEVAELLNWTLFRFDAAHIPDDFKPYTTAEVARLRRAPLRVETAEVRRRLAAGFDQTR